MSRNIPKTIEINQIKECLPHRYPFLLVDRIVDYESNTRAVGIKNVTINEQYFKGHFPGHPVMPGALIIEALAQTAGVLVKQREDCKDKLFLFMAINNAKFRKIVVPGDQLKLEVELVKLRSRTGLVKGIASVDGMIAAEAELLFGITERTSPQDKKI